MYNSVWVWCMVCVIALVLATLGARLIVEILQATGAVIAFVCVMVIILRTLAGW
jgi:hypothetical protein